MLNAQEQTDTWDDRFSAEVRANYYAELCSKYVTRERILTWLTLVSSSGAVLSIIVGRPSATALLAVITTCLTITDLVLQYQSRAFDCKDLHFCWNQLAAEYQSLWNHMHDSNSAARLLALNQRGGELSTRGAAIPINQKLLNKWCTLTAQSYNGE